MISFRFSRQVFVFFLLTQVGFVLPARAQDGATAAIDERAGGIPSAPAPFDAAARDAALRAAVEEADLIAFGEIVADDTAVEDTGVEDTAVEAATAPQIAFRAVRSFKGDAARTVSIVASDPSAGRSSDTPALISGSNYVLFLRRMAEPGTYAVIEASPDNHLIDRRLLTPSGEPLDELEERLRAAGATIDPAAGSAAWLLEPASEVAPSVPEPVSGDDPDDAAKGSAPPLADAPDQVILAEGFEGAFPGPWLVFDNNGATGGELYWDDTSFRSAVGSWSAGCADGGANASPPGGNYANGMSSWMVFGPFSLSDAVGGSLSFRYWNRSEVGFDFFKFLVSTDGTNFHGFQVSGDSGGWQSQAIDFTNVPTLGDVTGDASVWIAFVFTSDSTVTDEGAYVDEVVVEKTVASAADLDLELVDAVDGTYSPADNLSVSNTTRNVGGATSSGYRITFYASTNDIISTGDRALYFVDRAGLAPGAAHQFVTTGPLPDDLAAGTYYIGAILSISDASSANNVNHDPVPITVGGASIDLQAVDVYFRDQPQGQGNRVDAPDPGDQLYAHFEYQVTAASPVPGTTWRLELPLTGNVLCTFSGTEPAGGRLGWCNSPWTATEGLHNLRGELDAADAISETSESNNTAFRNFTIGSGTPEIRITPLTLGFDATATSAASTAPAFAAVPAAPIPGVMQESLAALARQVAETGKVRVIVGLEVPFVPEGALAGPDQQGEQRARIDHAQDAVLGRLAALDADLYARFEYIPFMALEVDSAALAALAAIPGVTSLEEDVAVPPTMASSNPVIGSPAAWAAGFTGAGQVVAVLDTGVDADHPYFDTGGAKVVSEACYSSTNASSTSVCPGGVTSSTATGSGAPCSFGSCDHGTHVAGTVAGDDGSGPNFGVARGADLIAVQIFSRFDSSAICSPSPAPCPLTWRTDQIKGLERIYALRTTFDVAAVNMSLGGGSFSDQATCDAQNASAKAAIDNLRSAGIATVISAGNDGSRTSLGAPGCISTAVSVGATEDDDDVASFSNVASFLDLLAPGVSIRSAVPGGGTGLKNGTSMAAPHVAGAWAVLEQASPGAGVDEILAALRDTGTIVDDERSGGTVDGMRRINVDLALASLPGGSSGSFTVFNDGTGTLAVQSIALDTAASWIGWSPAAPFDVAPGGSRQVAVTIDPLLAPAGQSTRRLIVQSNDADESPYPGGVFVTVDKGGAACPPGDLSLTGQSIGTGALFEACGTITAGSGFSVLGSGDVTLRAGAGVVLSNGFAVLSGGRLRVEIVPAW